MVNGPKRRSGHSKLKGLSERVGHQRGDVQIRKEPSLRSVVRMADIVAGHDFLVGQFTNARHVRNPFLAIAAGSGHCTAQPAMSLGGIAASVKHELALSRGNAWPSAKPTDARDGKSLELASSVQQCNFSTGPRRRCSGYRQSSPPPTFPVRP